MIKAGNSILAADIILSLTAGEALSANDAVYISTSDGKAYKCDADDTTKMDFVGFAQEAASLNGAVNVVHSGQMTGLSGLTIGANYYLSGTAGAITATAPTNVKIVGTAATATILRIAKYPTIMIRKYDTQGRSGYSTTQFDITNPAGTTFRYTFDGTGTDPSINSGTFPVGTVVDIQGNGGGFASANKGIFLVTGSGANYFEITNASGTVQSNVTIGTGYLLRGFLWTKLPGLKFITVECVAAGGGGAGIGSGNGGSAGGSASGYARKVIHTSALGATENIIIGAGGLGGSAGTNNGLDGIYTKFGSIISVPGGTGGTASSGSAVQGSAGSTPTGGDVNAIGGNSEGGLGTDAGSSRGKGGHGGASYFGSGGAGGSASSGSAGGQTAGAYGSGGGGAASQSGATSGGNGADGVMILTEYY